MRKRKRRGAEKLGALLQRKDDARRTARAKECLMFVDEVKAPRQVVTKSEVAGVEQLFLEVRQRLEEGILASYQRDTTFGETGVVTGVWAKALPAVLTLERVCWPLRVPEGIQLRSNRFYYLWRSLCDWAAEEELAIELLLVHDTQTVKARYELRVCSVTPLAALD